MPLETSYGEGQYGQGTKNARKKENNITTRFIKEDLKVKYN
jgi:hypothetical protein